MPTRRPSVCRGDLIPLYARLSPFIKGGTLPVAQNVCPWSGSASPSSP